MFADEIQEIEINIEQAKSIIEESEALDRLFKNPDFIKIIKDGYFRDNAVRLVELLSSPAMSGQQKQDDVLRSLRGIGELQQHFNAIAMKGKMAKEAIDADRQMITEIIAEQAERGIANV